jgi:aldehyde dehydrogenase (NAD(P)+)
MTVATPPTQTDEIDRDLAQLHDAATAWGSLDAGGRAALLERVRASVAGEAERWVSAAVRAKGLEGTPLAGEEWLSGPWAVLYALNRYVKTLREIERFGSPHIDPRNVRQRADGKTVVDVFPVDAYDRLLFSGIRAQVWMQPDVTPANLARSVAKAYRQDAPAAGVALVLAAGNIASIAPLDFLYKLIAENCVVIAKMNPVNDYLGPIFEDAFEPLVKAGFLRFAYGGADVGKYLCAHRLVDEIHITGSDRTHDAIVFGEGPEGAARKQRNEPLLAKPIQSELGNVSPTIVVPGPWSAQDFRFQAENVVTQKMHNGGFNCVASQVVVLPETWDGTPRLIEEIRRVLSALADRPAYYPGAGARTEQLTQGRAGVERFGRDGTGFVSRTLVRAEAASENDVAFTTEAFAPALAFVALPGDVTSYLERAVTFSNEELRGTLGANLIVHPATQRQHPEEIDAAVADLRYGTVGVNVWTGVGYFICETPWGAFPGNSLDDVGSGIGVVHNALLFDRSEKSVVYGPFAPFPRSLFGYGGAMLPKPPWFVTNRVADRVGRALCDFEVRKTPLNAAKIAALALRG